MQTGLVTAMLLAVLFTGLSINKAVNDRQEKLIAQKQEEQNQAEAARLVEGLLAANTAQVSTSLASLKEFRTWADPKLQQAFQEALPDSDARLHAGLALVADGQTVEPTVLEFLRDRLLTVTPAQFAPVRELLSTQQAELIPAYWNLAMDDQQPAPRRFRAACALAAFDSTNPSWEDSGFSSLIAEQLVTVSPEYIGEFKELLRPVAPQLVPAIGNIFKDPDRGELAKTLATSLLADYAVKDPGTLTEMVLAADPVSDKALFPALQQHQASAVRNLEAVLEKRLEPDWKDAPPDPAWTEPAAAVRARIESAHGMIAERFAFCQDMPLFEFLELAESLRTSGYRPTRIRPHQSLLPLAGGEGARRADEGVVTAASPTLHSTTATPASEGLPPSSTTASEDREGDRAGGTRRVPATLVAAIWTRDTLRWHLDPGLKKSDIPVPDAPAIKDGLLLTDIAPLPLAAEATEPQFIALWSEPGSDEELGGLTPLRSPEDEQRRVLLDVTEAELTAAQAELTQQGFASQSTISVRTDSSGQRRYTAIWSNEGAPSEFRPAYAGFELVHRPQWDVAVAPAARLADPLETFRQQLTEIEKLPAEKQDDPQVREARAAAQYQLGHLEPALADLDFLISKEIATASVLQYRTLALARLGKADEAEESLTKYLATDASASFKLYVQIQVPAWLGDFEQASTELESAVTAAGQSTDDLYNVACAAAMSSQAFAEKDPTQSQKFADRTIQLLRQMVAQGYSNASQLKSDADFASLHGTPRFIELLSRMEPPATYAALWRADVEFESKLLAAVPTTSAAAQLKPMLAEGWRPFAIAVDYSGGARSAPSSALPGTFSPDLGGEGTDVSTVPSPPGKGEKVAVRPDEGARAVAAPVMAGLPTVPLCSVLLHRPLIPDAAKESLALQHAAATTALLRLNAAEKVWPLFQDQPDPRLRSYVLHRLTTYRVDPQSLFTQLQQESNVSRQRSLILGLGELARAKLLSPEQQTALIADLAKRYADDPDSGIHGAAEWTLRQLGANATIAEVRAAYSTGTAVGDRRWYLTKTGGKPPVVAAVVAGLLTEPPSPTAGLPSPGDQRIAGRPTVQDSASLETNTALTFAILDVSDEFLMGSPVSEVDRYQGSTGRLETRHRRRIDRRFAIGMHEVTVSQFRAFRSEHVFDRTKAREEDSPANMIIWYDAAAYCNWLSAQEGLPRDQWCYEPNQQFSEGMSLLPDYLQRTGYRLLSEAEWEYACRAGTVTARYFGETETLLGEYVWYTKTSGDKWMLPVGTLKPNGAGLFDMQGNVLEWCQDTPFYYDTDIEWMEDKGQTGKLSNSGPRVLRGGSFANVASYVRSAFRNSNQPDNRYDSFGFRVGRTLPCRNSPGHTGGACRGAKSIAVLCRVAVFLSEERPFGQIHN
jgi:formylglycine-generating enzyme required for sulfatase activity